MVRGHPRASPEFCDCLGLSCLIWRGCVDSACPLTSWPLLFFHQYCMIHRPRLQGTVPNSHCLGLNRARRRPCGIVHTGPASPGRTAVHSPASRHPRQPQYFTPLVNEDADSSQWSHPAHPNTRKPRTISSSEPKFTSPQEVLQRLRLAWTPLWLEGPGL